MTGEKGEGVVGDHCAAKEEVMVGGVEEEVGEPHHRRYIWKGHVNRHEGAECGRWPLAFC